MTETLLQSDQAPTPPQSYLTELVGDGKKFKDPEALAKGKYEADTYVKHLERQLDEMRTDYTKLRDDYNARAKLEEIIDQHMVPRQPQQPPAPTQQQQVPQPSIDSAKIESLVSSKIQEHELTKKQQENFNVVKSKLEEKWGSNYAATLREQVSNLGLTEDFVNNLAKTHPQVLLKTLGVDQPVQQQTFQAPPKSEQRRDNFAPTNQKRSWSYYQNLKKSDPKTYWNPQTQVQMHHDSVALGEAFKDGDFNAY